MKDTQSHNLEAWGRIVLRVKDESWNMMRGGMVGESELFKTMIICDCCCTISCGDARYGDMYIIVVMLKRCTIITTGEIVVR